VTPRLQPTHALGPPDAGGADEGVDLHYQDVGAWDLARGDALGLEVGAAAAPYDRLVLWDVPDARDGTGHRTERTDPLEPAAGPWDAIRFENPFPFPMTTAPAQVSEAGRFLAQVTSSFANPGEVLVLRTTRALSLSVEVRDWEESGGQEAVELLRIGSRSYRKVVAEAELVASNRRDETLRLQVRRRVQGELREATHAPRIERLATPDRSLNPLQELLWEVQVEPRQELRLRYRHELLVPH
jgi:hypothetical protein